MNTVTGNTTLYAQWDIAWHLHYVNGYEDGKFRPENDISRAEAAQMICNLMKVNGITTTPSSGSTLKDVNSGDWYYSAVTYLAEQGIIEGYEDGYYRPKQTIKRDEFTALIVRYAGLETSSSSSDFSDVKSNHWASGYISAAVSAGYVEGYENGTFKPEANISRAEAVTMLNRVDGRYVDRESYSGLTMPFSDVKITYWAYYQILEASIDHEIHYK